MRESTTSALPRGWCAADGHGRSMPRRIRFSDEDVRDLPGPKPCFDLEQVRFVARRETDRVGAGGEVAGRGLTGGVDELGTDHAKGKVPADDADVTQRFSALATSSC